MKNLFTSYQGWLRRKILVIHMSTLHVDVEKELEVCHIDFDSWKFEDINIEEAWESDGKRYCGIIITGSLLPHDVMPPLPDVIFHSGIPVLGLCYGHEIMGVHLGSNLVQCNGDLGEFSEVEIELMDSILFSGLDTSKNQSSVMAHHLMLDSLPNGTKLIAKTSMTPIAGFESIDGLLFGLQFHPEKSWLGQIIFNNFYLHCIKMM